MKIWTYFDTDRDLPKDWTVKQLNDTWIFTKQKQYTTFYLQAFPGDCGTLLIRNISGVTREALQLARKVASMCGFDTIVGTYVNVDLEADTSAIQNFKAERWIKAVDGKSNRKHNYKNNRKIVYILHIRNCDHKGY